MPSLLADEIHDVRRSVRDLLSTLATPLVESRAASSADALSIAAELEQLGLLDIGSSPEAGGLGAVGAVTVLTEIARVWPSLAWTVMPRVLLGSLSDDVPAGLVGLASTDLGAFTAPFEVGRDASGVLRFGGSLSNVINGSAAANILIVPPGARDDSVLLVAAAAATVAGEPGFEGLLEASHQDLTIDGPAQTVNAPLSTAIATQRLLTAAVAVGIARASVASGRDYMRARVQFGRPIIEYGEMRAMLANAVIRTRAAADVLMAVAEESSSAPASEADAAVAFSTAAEAAVLASEVSQHAHGGYGHMVDFAVHRFVRDARMISSCVASRTALDEAALTALDLD